MDENDELESLLRRAQTGDSSARETLLGLLHARARRYADHLLDGRLADRADASDMAQEAFVRIGDSFDPAAFPSVPHLLAWLNTIVRNAVTDFRRHSAAQVRDRGREVAGGDLFPGLASDTTDPVERVGRGEQAVRLDSALQSLSEKQRAVFLLRLHENLPFEEIARRTGVTVANARVMLLRATQTLREKLGDQA
jgi:RNA polymerase sigma-70 factor, ECF subfamily